MRQINTELIAVIEKSPQIKIVEVPGGSYQPILMSVTQPPFDNVKVRQAMKYLVDREAFVKAVLQGRGQPGNYSTRYAWPTFGAMCHLIPLILPKRKPY